MSEWPRFETCPRCGAEVLRARHGNGGPGRGYVLERNPIVPLRKSPSRSGPVDEPVHRGRWRVAVDLDGNARRLGATERREPGESVHRRHRCESSKMEDLG